MNNTKTILAAVTSLAFIFTAYGEEDHTGHDHAKGEHQHAEKGHDHAKKAAKKIAGPNGGKILTEVAPHAEFFVTKDRKVRITFLDKDNKPIAVADQKVTLICGDRKAPTKLTLKKEADAKSLLSDGALPEGNNIPTIVTFKMTPDGKNIRAKFSLNLDDCPSCDYKEYACTCAHGNAGNGHDDHEGHNH